MVEARTFRRSPGSEEAREKAYLVERREHILRHAYENVEIPFEDAVGGWLPFNGDPSKMSQTASDIFERQRLKEISAYDDADIIRRVIMGGSVEIRDTASGTFWFFD
jgi:hypothetical protein